MSTNLSRRALLRGSVTAAAAATVTTLPIAVEAALPEADPVLDAWRAWRLLEDEADRLRVERDNIWASLPEAAKKPVVKVKLPNDGRELTMPSIGRYDGWIEVHDEMERLLGEHPERPSFSTAAAWMRQYRPNFLRRFRRAQAKAQRLREESGHTALGRRLDAIWEAQDPLWIVIDESTSVSPVAIAAKIDVGLSEGVVNNLLPQLPADMAATLRGAGGVA